MYQNQYRQPPRQNSGYDQSAANQPHNSQVKPFQRNNQNDVPMQRPQQGVPMQHNQAAHEHYQGNVNPYPNQHQAPMQNALSPIPQARREEKAKLDRPEWFLQLNTFGGKHAFQVETSITKSDWFTVNIESAERENPNDPNNKRYLWNNKTVLQMTKSELPIFAAVMLGFLPSARFDNHDTKFLEVVNQGKNFFIKSGGQNKAMHVAPVPTVEAYMYGTMALTQYCRNFHGLSTEAGLQIIKGLAAQLSECGGHKPVQPR